MYLCTKFWILVFFSSNTKSLIFRFFYFFLKSISNTNKEEIQKLGLINIVVYIADFKYNGKTIAAVTVGLDRYIFDGEEIYSITANRTPQIYFSGADILSDMELYHYLSRLSLY